MNLSEVNGRYELEHAFTDLYDSTFVVTGVTGATEVTDVIGGTGVIGDSPRGATPKAARHVKPAPRIVSLGRLAEALSPYDVVVYGEIHTHPGVHLHQMEIFQQLFARNPKYLLSLEQFERDTQGVVDDYLAGHIGESALTTKARAWSNYSTSYRPLVTFAKAHHLPVIAAEAPSWAISCIGELGLDILARFTPVERGWVAHDIDVAPGPYKDRYTGFLQSSPGHAGGAADRSFAAQAARDDTMAESIERALRNHPGYKVLHLTGNFHAAAFLGLVARLHALDPALKVAVIDPVEVEDPDHPAFDSAKLGEGTALQLVYPLPADFVEGEDTSGFMAKMTRDRASLHCKYAL